VKISFVGGTGPAGTGLAERFAKAGHTVILGSRTLDRAEAARDTVMSAVPGADAHAAENATAVAQGDVVFLTVPFDAQRSTVESLAQDLAGKIVVSIANPIRVQDRRAIVVPQKAGSLAEEVMEIVPTARVIGALHEIRVSRFADLLREIRSDTVVCGDDADAKRIVMELLAQIPGLRPLDGGPLDNSRYVEGFVAVLITMNFTYRAGTSFRITGIKEPNGD
jgi:hypothetical protein